MKTVYIIAAFMLFFASSCQKNSPSTGNANPSNTDNSSIIADFKIANIINGNCVKEGKNLALLNNSQNAVSYHWNFGNGITSDDIIPSKIAYVPCGSTYTITLVAKDLNGKTSSVSKTVTVLCSGKNTHGTYIGGE